jgi:hypothetical protein
MSPNNFFAMIEFENSKDLRAQIPVVTEKKLSQLLLVCTCILAAQTTNLSTAAKRMGKVLDERIRFDAAYARLKRFFQTGNSVGIFKFVCILTINTFCQSPGCFLLLDRTNWKYGKTHINLLVIGLLYRDVFIPLVWLDLGRAGNSNCRQRLDLVDKLLSWWPLTDVPLPKLHIAGDREFIGFDWFKGLEKRGIKFVMRIPASFKVELWHKGKIKDRKLGLKIIQRYLSASCKNSVEAVLMSELIVRLTAFDNDSPRGKAKHIFLMTNMEDMPEASKFYRKRYKIEICFKHLKNSGLRLEELAVQGQHKTDLMFAVLTLIYVMTIQKGIVHFEEVGPQEMRMFYGPKPYIAPAKSVFMQGFEDLLATVFSFEEFIHEIRQLFSWFAKPQNPLYQHFYTLEKFVVQ